MRKYILNFLIAVDQLFNTLIGGAPDETLSASAWVGSSEGKRIPRFARAVIDYIASKLGETDHCYNSYISELKGSQLPDSYRAHVKRKEL